MLVIEQYTICLSISNHPTDGYLQNNAIILFFTNIKLLIKEVFFPKTALFLGILVPLLVITVLSLPITKPFLIIIISLLFIIELLLLFTESYLPITILLLVFIIRILVNTVLALIINVLLSGKYVLNKQLY